MNTKAIYNNTAHPPPKVNQLELDASLGHLKATAKGKFAYFIDVSGGETLPKTRDPVTPELPPHATAA